MFQGSSPNTFPCQECLSQNIYGDFLTPYNASAGLLAYITVSKFQDALPLYRQTQLFQRIGVELARGTLATWMLRSGALFSR